MKHWRVLSTVAAGGAMIVLPLTAVGVGAATTPTPGPDTQVTVPSGLDVAALPGASAFGDTPADTPETVSFVLREQNESQLASSVTGGARNFLTVGQFASRYGQSPAHVAALRSYLAQFGISTSAYADNIDVVATGTAGEFDRALSVQQHQYHVPRQPAHARTPPVQAL